MRQKVFSRRIFTHSDITNNPQQTAEQDNDEQLREKGHAVGHMSPVSWITQAEGASFLFYSSTPGITVKLLLSIGAAGRPISPIWSKNLLCA